MVTVIDHAGSGSEEHDAAARISSRQRKTTAATGSEYAKVNGAHRCDSRAAPCASHTHLTLPPSGSPPTATAGRCRHPRNTCGNAHQIPEFRQRPRQETAIARHLPNRECAHLARTHFSTHAFSIAPTAWEADAGSPEVVLCRRFVWDIRNQPPADKRYPARRAKDLHSTKYLDSSQQNTWKDYFAIDPSKKPGCDLHQNPEGAC